jgi:protein ImuA
MATSAVAREAVFALRREIARIEGTLAERLEPAGAAGSTSAGAGIVLRRQGAADGMAGLLPTGAGGLDAALGGGLPRAALVEIHGRETRDAGAVAGFALALVALARRQTTVKAPLLWVAAGETFPEAGSPYAPGILHRFGLPPDALLLAQGRRLEDALWVAEEAAALGALSAVLLEVRGRAPRLDLTATRRLHRRTQAAGRPLYLLRHAGEPAPTAAPVRLVVSAAPAAKREILSGTLAGSIGPPAFTVAVSRSRLGMPATFTLDWNDDECAFHERQSGPGGAQDHGAVVSAVADGARPEGTIGAGLALRGAA